MKITLVNILLSMIIFGILPVFGSIASPVSSIQDSDTLSILNDLEKARNSLKSKNFAQAIIIGESVLEKANFAKYPKGIISALLIISEANKENEQFPSAFDSYLRALSESEKSGTKKDILEAYRGIGDLFIKWQVFPKATEYLLQANNILNISDPVNLKIEILEQLAFSYLKQNDYQNAILYYLEALQLKRNESDELETIATLDRLRDAYMSTNQYERALDQNLEILELGKKIEDSIGIGNSLNNIGFLYKNLGNYEGALNYFQESLLHIRKLNTKGLPSESEKTTLLNIGAIYNEVGEFEKSTGYYLEALKIWRGKAKPSDLAMIYYHMAYNHSRLENYRTAILHSEAANTYAKEAKDLEYQALAYKLLSEIYGSVNDNSKALFYYHSQVEISDQIMQAKKLQQQKEIQRQFEVEKRENEFRILMVEKEMKALEVKKLEFDGEKKQQELELLLQERELQTMKLKSQRAEKIKTQQQLELSRRLHNAQVKDQQLAMYRYRDSISALTTRKQQLEEKQKERELELLHQQKANQELILEEQNTLQRIYIGGLVVSIFILFLILRSYFISKRSNSRLARQNQEIKTQKDKLEKAMAKLKEAQSQLVQSEKMASLGQLTAGIAHEINNPMNFVYAGVDGLSTSLDRLMRLLNKYDQLEQQEGNENELLKEARELKNEIHFEKTKNGIVKLISAVRDGASRTVEIINGLRNFSRMDEKVLKYANIHKGLDDTLLILNNELNNKEIVLEKDYDQQMPEIMCYPGQLNQVFMNILSNAIQAIPKTGVISILTRCSVHNIKITIKDSGIGMTDDVREKIFEPFFTTKTEGQGTGLGLSISYGIIQKHQGKLLAQSKPGKGSDFVIILPRSINVESEKKRIKEPELLITNR